MNSIFILFLFAIIEYIITLLITNNINILNYDYISSKYTSFNFSNSDGSPNGLNYIIKLFLPPIYIIIVSGILYELKFNSLVNNIFWVTIIYYILRWLVIFVLNRVSLIDLKNEFICFIVASFLSWFIYSIFIIKTTQIFISIDELRDGIWIGILTFCTSIVMKIIYNKPHLNVNNERNRRKKYIFQKYNKFKSKYNNIIKIKNDNIKKLSYAIMIYENYNRPIVYRFFEYIKFFLTGHATLGIMQVYTEKFITDNESVELGFNIIRDTYQSIKRGSKVKDKLEKVILKYNNDGKYLNEVLYIYYVINSEF